MLFGSVELIGRSLMRLSIYTLRSTRSFTRSTILVDHNTCLKCIPKQLLRYINLTMADCNDLPKIKFCGLEGNYSNGKDVSFDIVFLDYKSTGDDSVVLCGYNEENEEREIIRRLVTEGTSGSQDSRLYIVFKACEFRSLPDSKFKFKYLSGDSTAVCESSFFEVEPHSISEESFLTVDVTESFDDSIQLVGKVSSDIVERLEDECKKLQNELKSSYRKTDEYESCCRALKAEKDRILDEFEGEKRQREKAEITLQELEGCLLDKMQCIDEQNRQIEELERSIRMETALHTALREDFEGHTSNAEECFIENEFLKSRINDCKREYVRLNKMNEDERDFYRTEFSRHESEIIQLKQMYQRKLDDIEERLAEAGDTIKELEERLDSEKIRSADLESQLHDMTKELDEQSELKEFEIAEMKKQAEEMQEILNAERAAKAKTVKDYESTIEELEQKLNNEVKKVNFLTGKCEGMQQRLTDAEEKNEGLKLRLEEADKKMVEMEDLVQSSKSELEILKKTVSAPEARLEKNEPSSKKEKGSKDKVSSKPLSKSASKTKEYPVVDSKWNWSREKEQAPESNSTKPKSSTTKIVYSYSESKRGGSRYSTRRRSSYQEDGYFEKEKSRSYHRNSSDRPERQTGLLRQHRNALLRENSRLRYTMTMLNHDCAILNYTLQQVVSEAEQKLDSLYSLYARKESECAAYESMFATSNLGYDPYAMPSEYVEAYYPDGSCMQSGLVTVNYGYYGEPYYDVYRPQDVMMQQQQVVFDQTQYQQLQYIPQMYAPTQQLYCPEPYPQVQHEAAVVQC